MSKQERCQVDEVCVIGFVPSSLVPTDNPNALDPFLWPLVRELKDGFIDVYEVENKGGLQEFEPEKVLIRLLIMEQIQTETRKNCAQKNVIPAWLRWTFCTS